MEVVAQVLHEFCHGGGVQGRLDILKEAPSSLLSIWIGFAHTEDSHIHKPVYHKYILMTYGLEPIIVIFNSTIIRAIIPFIINLKTPSFSSSSSLSATCSSSWYGKAA
eukprot:831013-Amphidinium_carterae.1